MSAEQETPDLWNPDLECQAWIKAPRIIGQGSHSHVCRREADHTDDPTNPLHLCGCGHEW